jgi:hypothetical protein
MRAPFVLALLLAAPVASAVPAATTQVFEITPDLRDCMYPMCGGWWISRVNHLSLRCADGTSASQCYIAEIDWPALGLDPAAEATVVAAAYNEQVVVRGGLSRVTFPVGGTFGVMTPVRAWVEVAP